eukprot:3941089-Rhodomonas_salina.3
MSRTDNTIAHKQSDDFGVCCRKTEQPQTIQWYETGKIVPSDTPAAAASAMLSSPLLVSIDFFPQYALVCHAR